MAVVVVLPLGQRVGALRHVPVRVHRLHLQAGPRHRGGDLVGAELGTAEDQRALELRLLQQLQQQPRNNLAQGSS